MSLRSSDPLVGVYLNKVLDKEFIYEAVDDEGRTYRNGRSSSSSYNPKKPEIDGGIPPRRLNDPTYMAHRGRVQAQRAAESENPDLISQRAENRKKLAKTILSNKKLKENTITEVLDSESEQGKGDMPQKQTDTISALGVHSQQRVKKAVYEINNRAKEQGVSIERAYFDFMKTATYGGLERNAIKQKLGIGVGGTSVKEERITEVTGFGGKVDPKTGKYDTSVTSPSQKKYREGLPTRSTSVGRGSSQSLTNVPAKNKYDGGVGDPDMAMTPARRADIRAKKLGGKAGNKIRSIMTRTEHREYILNRAVNKESFGWRNQLNELVGNAKKKTEKEELIKEMPAGESNKIIINPKLNEKKAVPRRQAKERGDYLDETLDALSEYFYTEGLNENGIEILIEDLGVDEFCEFVDEIIDEQLLFESSRKRREETRGKLGTLGSGMTKSGKSFKDVKGGARATSRRAARKALGRNEGPRQQALNRPGNSDMKSSLSRQSAIANAKKEQKPTNSTPTQTKEKSKGVLGRIFQRGGDDIRQLGNSLRTASGVAKNRVNDVTSTYQKLRAAGKKAEQSTVAKNVRKAAVEGGKAAAKIAFVAGKQARRSLNAGIEIEGDLIEQDDNAKIEQIKAEYLRRKKQEERRWDNESRAVKRKLAAYGASIEDLNNSYIHQIKTRFESNLNNSYVSDLEMTEEAPDINQRAVDAVINKNGGAGNFAKQRKPGEKLPPLKHPKNKGGVDPNYYKPLAKEFGVNEAAILKNRSVSDDEMKSRAERFSDLEKATQVRLRKRENELRSRQTLPASGTYRDPKIGGGIVDIDTRAPKLKVHTVNDAGVSGGKSELSIKDKKNTRGFLKKK